MRIKRYQTITSLKQLETSHALKYASNQNENANL